MQTKVSTSIKNIETKSENFFNWWQLHTNKGRQVWHFTPPKAFENIDWESEAAKPILNEMSEAFRFNKKRNPNSADKVYRIAQAKKEAANISSENEIENALLKGWNFYSQLQTPDGNWPGDYGGPHFLLPGLIVVAYITETPFPAPHRALMKRYMLNHQNEDGGWGTHIEGQSTLFGTILQYVALRIMGATADAPEMQKARAWIHQQGGARGIPSWGKFYLSALSVYEWEGCNTLIPEIWLLPENLPIHPSKYWCHTRMVYLPMSYCYGVKLKAKETALAHSLRKELYTEPYEKINWSKARNEISKADEYAPMKPLLKELYKLLNVYEKNANTTLRKKALDFCIDYINAEDEQTNYIDIGPVNQVINSLALWHRYGKNSEPFQKHVERWYDYLWVAEDGMKMNGYNGSQLWDTAFASQALLEGNVQHHFAETAQKALDFVQQTQIKEEVKNHKKFFRHKSLGGWPFSTLEHGWPITDCTAEGLKTVLAFRSETPIINQSIDLLLSLQNKDGGWATYELQRAPAWLEILNPSGVFGKIMVDYSWTECSSACIQALRKFQQHDSAYRKKEIEKAIAKGEQFIRNRQREDGSWVGAWAVCFTYGTWFGVEALMAAGSKGYSHDAAVKKACEFLISKQNEDGGWGESYLSCVQKKYVPHQNSQVVNTAWALLTLMAAKFPKQEIIDKGIRFLMTQQQPNGDWQQGAISGVFNLNCMITYTSYRNVFPLWALGRWHTLNQ